MCWTCRAYTTQDAEFLAWMKFHCPAASCIYRFNSGDPAYIVDISSELEATVFKMSWLTST